MRRLVCLSVIIVLLVSCSKIDEQFLIGKYHYKAYQSDIIYLFKNHTHSHKHTNTQGKVFEVHGKWTYNGKEISFYDFNFFNDLGAAGGGGTWISEVEESDDKIQLIYSYDTDHDYFEKE